VRAAHKLQKYSTPITLHVGAMRVSRPLTVCAQLPVSLFPLSF
jgi:hypothetical protein